MNQSGASIAIIDAVAQVQSAEIVQPATIEDLRPKTKVKGVVKRLELYGAFIDLGIGVDALIHISQLGNKRVNRVSDVLAEGETVEVWVDRVVPVTGQISVTMVEPQPVDWNELQEGQAYVGTVTRLERFGAFVDIGAEKEGLVHVSELSHEYVRNPNQVVRVGDRVNVLVLGFNKKKRRIDLSIKALLEAPEAEEIIEFVDSAEEEEDNAELPTSMEIALRRALSKESPEASRARISRSGRQQKQQLRKQQNDILSRTLANKSE